MRTTCTLALVVSLLCAQSGQARADAAPGPESQAASEPATHRTCPLALERCRAELVEGRHAEAKLCLIDFLARCPDEPQADLAAAMAELATRLQQAEATSTSRADDAEDRPEPISVSAVMTSGMPELVLNSTLWGGAAGFATAASIVSATRINQVDSLPALVATPAFGAAVGLGTSLALCWWLRPSAGDLALVSSAMWVGSAYSVALQVLFDIPNAWDQRRAYQRVPRQFAGALIGSALFTSAAVAATPWVELDPGDIGLMNSGAIWGAVIPGIVVLGYTVVGMVPDTTALFIPLAGSIFAYGTMFALAPLLDAPRPATWLIEAGGLLGMLTGVATMPILSFAGASQAALTTALLIPTILGLAGGAASTFLVSSALSDKAEIVARLPVHLAPLIALDTSSTLRAPAPVIGLTLGGQL